MATPGELNKRKVESYKIFDEIAKTYDFLNHLLSFGIDIYWRNKFLKLVPQLKKQKVLDLATGTADLALTLAKSPEIAHITGIDLSKEMIEIGKEKVKRSNKSHKIDLKIGDGVHIPFENETFDLVTISFGIRNFSDFKKSLKNIHRVLKDDGQVMIMEFSIPRNIFIKKLYFFYFRNWLPFIGNLISKHHDAYTYLNKTVETFPYGPQFLYAMEEAGFRHMELKKLTFGIATIYIGRKIK